MILVPGPARARPGPPHPLSPTHSDRRRLVAAGITVPPSGGRGRGLVTVRPLA